MDKPRIKEAIVVEGRYDKNTLSQAVDATILETGGFGVFKQREMVELMRRLAQAQGLIILTDSDGAGFLIRGHLQGMLNPALVKHAYIPDVPGKERRKRAPGQEGKLGVEGMPPQVLLEALRRAGATFLEADSPPPPPRLTGAEMFALGLTGRPNSAQRRAALLRAMNLPERLNANALAQLLPILCDREDLERMSNNLESENALQ
ncbi:MAG: DUF4093 domain-containing protein [Oscillospiraceae bacterium]|nr:DUF4093 domain-containing protein [Oscillospiraceae bacterium]